jgi:hypothetical protein
VWKAAGRVADGGERQLINYFCGATEMDKIQIEIDIGSAASTQALTECGVIGGVVTVGER